MGHILPLPRLGPVDEPARRGPPFERAASRRFSVQLPLPAGTRPFSAAHTASATVTCLAPETGAVLIRRPVEGVAPSPSRTIRTPPYGSRPAAASADWKSSQLGGSTRTT